jgi:hypothetical protein
MDECDDEGLHDGGAVEGQPDSKNLQTFWPDILIVANIVIDAWRVSGLAIFFIFKIYADTSCWVDEGGIHGCVVNEVLPFLPEAPMWASTSFVPSS